MVLSSKNINWASSLVILLIIGVHFYYFEPALSPLFDSDGAIHVLMSSRFYFPEGLYYWGQNRLGSMVPLLAYPWVSLGIHPLWVLSVIQTFLIYLSFRNFSFNLPSLGRVTLAFLFFVPLSAWNFLISTGQPYIPQLFLLSWIYVWYTKKGAPHSTSDWFSFFLVGWVSLWVSDLTLVYFVPIGLYFIFSSYKAMGLKDTVAKLYIPTGVLAIGVALLFVLKSQLPRAKGYDNVFASGEQIGDLVSRLVAFYSGYFTHFSAHPLETIGFWFLGIGVILLGLRRSTSWIAILKASQWVVILFLITSHWVFVNGLRYFALPFFLLTVLWIRQAYLPVPKSKAKSWSQVLLLLSTLLFSAGNITKRRTIQRPTVFMPQTHEIQKVATLYSLPAIGDYWTVYQYSAYAKNQPIGIADEFWAIRNSWEASQVLQSDTVLIFASDRVVLEAEIEKYKTQFEAVSSVLHVGETSFRLYRPHSKD